MENEEPEIHALDRDYSQPIEPSRQDLGYDPKLRLIGISGFAGGFAVVFMSAILLSNASGNTAVESFGSVMHQFGMVLILIGAVVIIAAYRIHQLRIAKNAIGGKMSLRPNQSIGGLLVWNLIAFVCLALILSLAQRFASPMLSFFVYNSIFTITCGLMLTIAIWHRGMLRGFACGLLVGICLNVFSGLIGMSLVGMNSMGGSNQDAMYMMAGQIALIQVTGIVCGVYVCMLEASTKDAPEAREWWRRD